MMALHTLVEASHPGAAVAEMLLGRAESPSTVSKYYGSVSLPKAVQARHVLIILAPGRREARGFKFQGHHGLQ